MKMQACAGDNGSDAEDAAGILLLVTVGVVIKCDGVGRGGDAGGGSGDR